MDTATDFSEIPRRLPGQLRGGARLVLHSYQAATLVRGQRAEPARAGQRRRPAILGLFGFASLLNTIREGAADHDPYARWWLKRIDEALFRAEEELLDLQNVLNEECDKDQRYSLNVCQSVRPAMFELRFAHPQAYRAARLLATYDLFVLEAMAYRHHALLPGALVTELLRDAARIVRRTYLSPTGYRRTGVRYSDIRAGNALAEQAHALMGPLPSDWYEDRSDDGESDEDASSESTSEPQNSSVLTAVQ